VKPTTLNRLHRARSGWFSARLVPECSEPMISECWAVQCRKGQPVRRFERMVDKRAEAFDCLVSTCAAQV